MGQISKRVVIPQSTKILGDNMVMMSVSLDIFKGFKMK